MGFLSNYLYKQKSWSQRVFGDGKRTVGITEHIKSEIEEIRENPSDPIEWVDIIILALDGFWRCGGNIYHIEQYLTKKQEVNFLRQYDKRPENQPSFHKK